MDSVKKVSNKNLEHHPSAAQHKVLQKSTTLNRKFVKRPVVQAQIAKRQQLEREAFLRRKALAERMGREKGALIAKKRQEGVKLMPVVRMANVARVEKASAVREEIIEKPVVNPTVEVARARVAARKAPAPRQLTAQELKDRAIQQALRKMATAGDADVTDGGRMTEAMTKQRGMWRKRKLFVALGMSVVSIALLGYLVHLNLPDLSVRVAAMQSGIESAYPAYIPKGYRMNGLVAENGGKITIDFSHKDGKSFTLTQEKSSWDSAALLSQFVLPRWGENYEVMKEQGLTIYAFGSDAVWMNGGVFYFISDMEDDLTKQQLHDIAVSL